MLTEIQSGVVRGIAVAAIATFAGVLVVVLWQPDFLLPRRAFPQTLMASLKWDVLIVLCLALNIGSLARHRFFTPQDIDGGGLTEGTPRAKILQSTLQNTLEQAVLAVCTHSVWAATMPNTATAA